ncbi:MAG: hypothetical protein U0228_20570 [Myxococcaceae bacterium]
MSLNRRRALAQLQQATLHHERGEWAQVETLVRPVLDEGFDELAAFFLLGEALRHQGKRDEARQVLEAGLEKHKGAPELEARLGNVWLDLDRVDRAIELLSRARAKLNRDPGVLTTLAAALLRAGRAEEAEAQLARALLVGGGPDARLVLAGVKARRGQLEEADRLAAQVESGGPALAASAKALRAEVALLQGDAKLALDRWKELEALGAFEDRYLPNMAWAAALAGESALATSLIERRRANHPAASDFLLFAQFAIVQGDATRALRELEQAAVAPGVRDDGWDFEFRTTRGRALRLAGQGGAAARELEAAVALPESAMPRLGAAPFVDLGFLALDAGEFETAEKHFARALELDRDEAQAKRGLELARKRLGWRDAVEASAEEKVKAAREEAEALRRRFVVRETELEQLKREVERLKAQRTQAEQAAREASSEAEAERVRLAAEKRSALAAELEQRQVDVDAKSVENLERAFGGRERIPSKVWQALLVAEKTYQQALYTELPAAAVAVLFSGAFERTLVDLFATGFDSWLEQRGQREAFLSAGVRERRGTRAEYFDRFFEWFDRSQDARPPALGEISRVLEKRDESHLVLFRTFLRETFKLDDAFWSAFAGFVQWSKETLRDPVAHGHIELDWQGLKEFRERLLFSFGGQDTGALPRLLLARVAG